MKTPLILLSVFSLFIFSRAEAQANKEKPFASDPSYSVHNYKHPNKAAQAKKWAANRSQTQFVVVQEVIPSLLDSRRNYKKSRRSEPVASSQEVDKVKSKPIENNDASLLQE